MYEYVRVVWDCKERSKRCLFLRPGWSSQRELCSLSTNIVELTNAGHGEHRASGEADDGAHCGREGGKLYPDRIGGEVVARGAGGVRSRERSPAVQFIYFLNGARCSNQAENYFMTGDGDYFLSFRNFRFPFHSFCGAAVPCCAFSSVHITYQKKTIITLRTYGM